MSAERDQALVLPVILPRELLDLAWPGPIVGLDGLPFAVAWAHCDVPNRFVYLTHDDARRWDDAGVDWRAAAMANMAQLAAVQPAWGEKCDGDGRPFIKVMLHPDALGPSRLLVPHLFDAELGADYEIALPEQSCAIAYRRDLSPEQGAEVEAMIRGCFEHGTEPMSPARFAAESFWHFARS